MLRRHFAALSLLQPAPGRLLLAEDFDKPRTYTKEFQPIGNGWRVRAWQAGWEHTADGIRSVWTQGHMPVLAYEGSFRDAVIELEFRYRHEPGKKALCRISAMNPEHHPRAYCLSAWANHDSGERALGMVLEHDAWKPGFITTVDRKAAAFAPEVWHTVRLAVAGDEATATGGGVTVAGRYPHFALPKTVLAIGTGVSPHEIRRLRVYETKSMGGNR
jgi:hypothetical protein